MNEHDSNYQLLDNTLTELRPGTARHYAGLSVLPLLSRDECSAQYVLLEQAISRGTLTITEVSDAGSVPYLTAVNRGPWPVLIFDGEELVGAKQNRICNTTILVGVGKSVLPVSCVEQGRWSRTSASFSSGDYAAHPSLRMEKEALVRRSAAAAVPFEEARQTRRRVPQESRASLYGGAQHRVWEEVAETSVRLGVDSHTSALADSFETRRHDLEDYVRALSFAEDGALSDAVGAAVFSDGRFVCVDLLHPSARFAELYPKLLRGYALEALVSLHKRDFWKGARQGQRGWESSEYVSALDGFDPQTTVLQLFAQLKDMTVETRDAADLGEDIRLETAFLSGAGLAWNEELIQLSVFPGKAA